MAGENTDFHSTNIKADFGLVVHEIESQINLSECLN